MTDATIHPFPSAPAVRDATRLMERAREEHIAEFLAWLRHAHPSRDAALLEIEVFAATARQLVAVNTRAPRT